MIKYQKIQGVTVPNATGLPSITLTPEGRAMGGIPGWVMLYDPSYVNENMARNRAVPNRLSPNPDNNYNITSFVNGEPAIDASLGVSSAIMPETGDVDPDRWSFFLVLQDFYNDDNGTHARLIIPNSQVENEVALHIVLSASSGQFYIFENSMRSAGGSPVRLNWPEDIRVVTDGAPQLFMVTFSIENGLALWHNGTKVAENPDDKRPLTFGYSRDELMLLYSARGKYGMTGVLNIDLGASENIGHRRALESFIMNKYDIASAS